MFERETMILDEIIRKTKEDLEERKKMAMENISATEIEILRIWG